MLIKKLLMISAVMGAMSPIAAQSLQVTGKLNGEALPTDMRLFIAPVERVWDGPDSVSVNGGSLTATTAASSYHIYRLMGVSRQRQIIVPLALTAHGDKAELNVTIKKDGSLAIVKPTADTQALTAFNDLYASRSRQMWTEGKELPAAALKALLTGYTASADSLIKKLRPSETTAQYLRYWSAMLTFEGIESVTFATGRSLSELDIDRKAELTRLLPTADSDMAALFDSAPRLVLATLPKENGLADNIAAIEAQVKNTGLKQRAEDALLNRYVTSFNYAENYEAGLKELTDLTQRFGLSDMYLADFKVRKSSIAGTPFPDVKLYDLNGAAVDFSKYRGKYVYVDMWASWCVPCIKEIPYLKALEKELQNTEVQFLSISIDSNEAAWKKKVASLSLEGELLISKDNKLGEALNVRGIPFFLIYDKEGRLYKYNTYRPSDARLKPLLESLK